MADLRASLDAAREDRPVVADTTAGEAETVTITLPPNPAARRHRLAARSGGAQDDGLRARVAEIINDLDPYGPSDCAEPCTHTHLDRSAYPGLVIADRLRRALAGPDDARQDGVG